MKEKLKPIIYIVLFLATLVISYFAVCYSAFYNSSFLNYDSSVFYLIGRGIKNGYIPYKDLADHKGIYIFFVNFLGALISENKYIDIFIINLLINYCFVVLVYKIAALFSKNWTINILVAISSFVLGSSYFFCQGGMKCETMLMPIILYSYYLYLKHFIHNRNNPFETKKMFIIGIGAGIALFTKANICICFFPIIFSCIMEIHENRSYHLLIKYFTFGFLGILIGILPAITYGLLTKSLKEMIYYTFTANFLYTKGLYYKYNGLVDATINTIFNFKWVLLFSIVGICASYSIVKSKKIFLFLCVSFLSTCISSFMALRPYTYHSYPMLFNLLWLLFFVFIKLDKVLGDIHIKSRIKKNVLLSLFIIVYMLFLSFYTYNFSYKRNILYGYRQYLVNKELEKYYKKGDRLLVIGASIGSYNYFQVFPTIRDFCIPHTTEKFVDPMYDELLESIKKGENDWVITSFTPIMNRSNFPDRVNNLLSEKYEYVLDIPLVPATIYRKPRN